MLFFILMLLLTINFENHSSVILIFIYIYRIIQHCVLNLSISVAITCVIHLRYFPLNLTIIMHKTLHNTHLIVALIMSWCIIVINLVNQAFLTAAHPIIAKDTLWRIFPIWYFPFFQISVCENENISSA